MIEKLKMEQNPLSETVEKIREICPAAVTRDGKIDFEELKTSLATDVAEDVIEKYEFTWVGKNAAKAEANRSIRKTLRPVVDDSKDWDNTKNLYIEGDNLDALKLLQESYLNKVKMIYIDPPYNTGNDFVYCDNFKMGCAEFIEKSGQCDADGNRLFANTKTNGRFHSDWCSMMYPRLKIARNLLSDDGVIFISIDDHEQANLKKICDEIFGEDNFITQMIWQKKTGAADASNIATITESILVYAKRAATVFLNKNEGAHDENRYKYSDEFVKERGHFYYDSLDRGTLGYHESLDFPVVAPDGTNVYPNGRTQQLNDGWRWKWGKDKLDWGLKNKFIEVRKNTGKKSGWGVYYKIYEKVDNEGNVIQRSSPYKNLFQDVLNTHASNEAKDLFGRTDFFSNPKPSALIKHLSVLGTSKTSVVLDFFSGSATTAHAVMQLNAEDGGNRRFIMVQLPEETDQKSEAAKAGYTNICEIGKERIRRAGEKIKAENPDKDLDVGFRVLRVDSDNMADIAKRPSDITQGQLKLDVENIVPERSDLDLLFGVMVDCGLMLDMPIETKQMDDKTYYVVNHGDLVACFEKNIPEKLIYEIAKMNPVCAVFRDSSFAEPKDKINLAEIFKNITGNDKCVKVL